MDTAFLSSTTVSGGLGALACCAALTLLSLAVVCIRLIARLLLTGYTGNEEKLICAAWIVSFLLTVNVVMETRYGLGESIQEIPAQDLVNFRLWFWMSFWLYSASLSMIKLSVLLQYQRCFVNGIFRSLSKSMVIATSFYGGVTFADCIVLCLPLSAIWTENNNGQCVDPWDVHFANAVYNIATELFILLMPMSVLGSLRLQKKQKIDLLAIFVMGLFVCVAAMVRVWSLHDVFRGDTDLTKMAVRPLMWSAVELNLGIIVSSLLTLKPLLVRISARLADSTRDRAVIHWVRIRRVHYIPAGEPISPVEPIPLQLLQPQQSLQPMEPLQRPQPVVTRSRSTQTVEVTHSRSTQIVERHHVTRHAASAWESTLEEGHHRTFTYRTEIEARRTRRRTPPGHIYVNTTRTTEHDDGYDASEDEPKSTGPSSIRK